MHHVLARVAASLIALAIATPAAAQDGPSEIARELAALRAEIRQLRAEVDALKAREDAPPAPLDILQAQVSELAQVKVESDSKLPLKIFGTLHAGLFANSGAANWLDNPNLVAAAPADGHAGSLSASLRQTRLGIAADGPEIGALRTSAIVAMDFFGGIPGFQTGQVMGLPRLLVAYARIEGQRTAIEVGQDHMILAPRDPTSLAAYAFPALFRSGNLYLRVPQVRVEHTWASRVHATAGIVAPVGGDLTGDSYAFVPPALGGERSRRPGVQTRLAYTVGEAGSLRALDVGLSSHVGWEWRGTGLTRSWAAAVDLGARRDWLGVAGEWFAGNNVDAFGGAAGLDAPTMGGWGELQLFSSDRLSFAAGAGVDDIRDSRQPPLPRQRNRSAYGNIIFALTPELQMSFEYRWLGTLVDAGERTNHHVDWVLVRKF